MESIDAFDGAKGRIKAKFGISSSDIINKINEGLKGVLTTTMEKLEAFEKVIEYELDKLKLEHKTNSLEHTLNSHDKVLSSATVSDRPFSESLHDSSTNNNLESENSNETNITAANNISELTIDEIIG